MVILDDPDRGGSFAGAWAEFLSLGTLPSFKPAVAQEGVLNAFEGSTDTDARAHTPAVALSLHAEPIGTVRKDNPHA